jgi:hypothetical protein
MNEGHIDDFGTEIGIRGFVGQLNTYGDLYYQLAFQKRTELCWISTHFVFVVKEKVERQVLFGCLFTLIAQTC